MTNVHKINDHSNENHEPAYFAVIPAPVLFDTEISADAKILYAHIVTLARKSGYAFAANSYFERVTGKSDRAIRRHLKQLVERGHIAVDLSTGKIGIERKIYVRTEMTGRSGQICPDGADENVRYNNTSNNKTSNNKHIVDFIDRAVGIINETTSANFKPTTPKTKSLLTALFRAGYSISDVETVIKHKYDDWHNDPKMRKYLRPMTLFNMTKFESYLNDAQNAKTYHALNGQNGIGDMYAKL